MSPVYTHQQLPSLCAIAPCFKTTPHVYVHSLAWYLRTQHTHLLVAVAAMSSKGVSAACKQVIKRSSPWKRISDTGESDQVSRSSLGVCTMCFSALQLCLCVLVCDCPVKSTPQSCAHTHPSEIQGSRC